MAYRNAKIASVDDAVVNPQLKIQPSDQTFTTEGSSPAQDDLWLDITGTSPDRYIRLKVYDQGEWVTLAELQR